MQGHCVVVGFRVTWLDFFLTAKHVVRRAFGRRREHPKPTKVHTITIILLYLELQVSYNTGTSERRQGKTRQSERQGKYIRDTNSEEEIASSKTPQTLHISGNACQYLRSQ